MLVTNYLKSHIFFQDRNLKKNNLIIAITNLNIDNFLLFEIFQTEMR